MEMIDVLTRLKEIAETKPELVKDAVENVERTNPVENVGGMSDIHIGATDAIDEYLDGPDGDLTMPKSQVIADLKRKASRSEMPRSYEYEEAARMVDEKFDDLGKRKHEMEPDMQSTEQQTTEPQVKEEMTPMGTKMFFDMGAKLDIQFSMEQKGMMAGVLNKLDQDVLMKAVDEYKSQELDPDQAESNELNTETMTTEDKKSINEAITVTTDSPEEAGMFMQIMKLAGVKPVDASMIGGEPEAGENPEHGEPGHVCGADDDAIGSNDMAKMRDMMTAPDEEKAAETFANSPGDREKDEPTTMDVDTLVNVHSGGLNRQKNQYRKEYPGDNPMAVEDKITEEDLANSLRTQYESFKQAYQEAAKVAEGKAKPDFLDMDKDGNEKESMKKAVKDKEAK